MKYRLILTEELKLAFKPVGGLPLSITRDTPPPVTPSGYAYVEDEAQPTDELGVGMMWSRLLTDTRYGWVQVETVDAEAEWLELPAWRIRAVAKLTPFGDGTLMDGVDAAIAGITDPQEKAIAEEVFYHGNTLRRDSTLLVTMAAGLGVSDEDLDTLFETAFAIEV